MKIAIHHRPGSFSDKWIAYCQKEGIEYKIVNCYDSDIIEQVKGCNAIMWHHSHSNIKDIQTAKRMLFALEHSGIKVFPNFKTGWHFDDKVAQKYLLEAIDAPLVPSYVFYDEKEALEHIKTISFPIVAKLKGGAGSTNVKLLNDVEEAKKYIEQMFSTGISSFSGALGNINQKARLARKIKNPFTLTKKVFNHILKIKKNTKLRETEKGYFYYQEFIANNTYDTRVIVIGNRAFAIVRGTKGGDFRASGSGKISYDKNDIDLRMVEIAFKVSDKIKSQSIAFDFVRDNGKPLIVEISYGFSINAYDICPGFWDNEMNWHEGQFNPQKWMLQDIIADY